MVYSRTSFPRPAQFDQHVDEGIVHRAAGVTFSTALPLGFFTTEKRRERQDRGELDARIAKSLLEASWPTGCRARPCLREQFDLCVSGWPNADVTDSLPNPAACAISARRSSLRHQLVVKRFNFIPYLLFARTAELLIP